MKKRTVRNMKLMGILSIILIVCSMICGVWMYLNPGQGSVRFHAGLSGSAMVISLVSIVLYMIKR